MADNAVATANLAEAIGEAAPGAGLVLLGSAAQYGVPETLTPWKESDPCAPLDPYGLSKQAAETAAFAAARRLGFGVTALRIFNVVGAGAARRAGVRHLPARAPPPQRPARRPGASAWAR